MFCVKCQNDVGDCTCLDIEERLAALAVHPLWAIDFCSACGAHHHRCKCEAKGHPKAS